MSNKSSPASGNSNGDASAPASPRSYADVLRGESDSPIPVAAPTSAAPIISEASQRLFAKADKTVSETRVILDREMEKEEAVLVTAPLRVRQEAASTLKVPVAAPRPVRQEAVSTSTMPVAPQPDVRADVPRSPSPVKTSPLRAPAPSTPVMPSPLAAVGHLELCVVAEGVLQGTRRALDRVYAEDNAATSSAVVSDASQVQAPSAEVAAAWFADLEPFDWEMPASKSSSPKPVNSKPASPNPVSSDESIPYDDTGDFEQADSSGNATASIATPPKTPETSGQAAIRDLHDEMNATENILEKGKRQYIELEGTPEKPILDATEPEASSGSFVNPPWYEKAAYRTPTPSKPAKTPEDTTKKPRLIESESESDEEDVSDEASSANDAEEHPKPAPATPRSPAKRPRSPTPERPEVRPILQAVRRNRRVRSAPGTTEAPLISVAQRQEMMRHKEHRCPDCDQECRYVNMDDLSETDEAMPPPSTPRSERGFTPEPIHGYAPMDDMDFEDAVSDAGRSATPSDVGRAASPNDFEIPPLEPFSPPASPARRSASPMSGVSEVSLAMTSRPASPIRDLFCPRCHRDCNCPHVENPNPDFAPAPVRRPRGPRRVTTEEAWGRTANVDDIIGVDLPAPEPVLTEAMEVFDDGPLTANRQEKTIRRPTFQVVLFDNGVVVMRGTFDGVSLNSKLMAMAAKQPTVLFNDPDDRAVQIAAGRNHVVIRTRLGRLLTLGRGEEGQLGASERPQRYRQAAATVASLRRFIPGAANVVFEDIKAFGNVTKAKAKGGPWYVCGQGFKGILTEVISRRRTL